MIIIEKQYQLMMHKIMPSEIGAITPEQLFKLGLQCCNQSEYSQAEQHADKLYQLQHYQKAIDLYKCIIQDNLDHDYEITGLGSHQQQVGYYQWYSFKWYMQQRSINIVKSSPYDGLSLCCHSHSKYQDGIKWYAQMVRKYPNHYQLIYGYANILYNNSIYDQAVPQYEKVIKLKPNFVKPYINLAFTFQYKRIEKTKAVYWAEKALQLDPRNQYALFIIARNEKNIDKKIQDLKNVWALNQSYTRVANQVGICYGSKKKDYKQAIRWYKRCTKINPQYMSCYNNIGVNYELLKRYQQAKIWYFRAIEKQETYKAPHANLYDVFKLLKATDEDILSLAEQYQTKQQKFCYYFGLACYDKKKIQESIKWIQMAIAINPHNHAYHNSIGISYDDLKDYQMAINHYKKCMQINPKYHSAYYNIAIVYKALKQQDRAIQWYKKAIEVNPRYSYAYNNLANIYKNNKNYQEAIKYYKKAVENNSTYTLAYVNMGVCALNIENYSVAYVALARASATMENDNNNLSSSNKDFIKPHMERFKVEGQSWRRLGFASNSEREQIKTVFQTLQKQFSLVKKDAPLPKKQDILNQKILDINSLLLQGNFSLQSLSHIVPIVKSISTADIRYFSIIPQLIFHHFWLNKYSKRRHFQDIEAEISSLLTRHSHTTQTKLRMNSEGLQQFREKMARLINNQSTCNLFNQIAFFKDHQEVCAELLRINQQAHDHKEKFQEILQTIESEAKGKIVGVKSTIPKDAKGKAAGLMKMQEAVFESDLNDAHFTALTGWIDDGLQQTKQNDLAGIVKQFVTGVNQSLNELFIKTRFAQNIETVCISDGLIHGFCEFASLPDIANAIKSIQRLCDQRSYWMSAVRDRLSNSMYQDILVVVQINQTSYFTISLSLISTHDDQLWTRELTKLSSGPLGCIFASILYLARSEYSLLGHCRQISQSGANAKVKETATFVMKNLESIQ